MERFDSGLVFPVPAKLDQGTPADSAGIFLHYHAKSLTERHHVKGKAVIKSMIVGVATLLLPDEFTVDNVTLIG